MENGLVSIIVPVYRVEDYLERCILSLVFQTYKQIEIILVDDGSPDSSPEICESWKKKDSRINVIHKVNGGLSSARNEGLKIARGEFILFVDSDDWISIVMVERMAAAMREYGADMAVCQFVNVYPDGYCKKNWNCSDGIRVCTADEVLGLLLEDGEITNHVWRRLYRREILEKEITRGELFPVGKNFEDVFVSYRLLLQCRKIVVIDEAFYYYFRNSEGIVASCLARDTQTLYEAFCQREEELIRLIPERRDEIMTSHLKDDYFLWEDINYRLVRENVSRKEIRRLNGMLKKDIYLHRQVFRTGSRKIALFCLFILYLPFFAQIKQRCSSFAKILKRVFGREISAFYRGIKRGGSPILYILAAPEYGNLGDQALLRGEEKFAKKYLPEYRLVKVPYSKLGRYGRLYLRTHVRKGDIICVHAGGNIGTLYPGLHALQEQAIAALHKRKLTILPQTFYYEQTAAADGVLEETRKVYNKCRDLKITVREQASYRFVQEHFEEESYLFPDMALFLAPYRIHAKREGALICLRHDSEQTLAESDYQYLLERITARFKSIDEADTHLAWDPDEDQMQHEINKLLHKFALKQLVVTDRLHGMVFAALTETPCVVLLSKSHKVAGVYQWIEHLAYIRIVEKMEDLENAVEAVCNVTEPKFDTDNLTPYWDKLAAVIKRE